MAALALDAHDGPDTPEAREEALRYANAIIHALTFPAWKAAWSHHTANMPTGAEYFGDALGEGDTP